MDIRRLTLSILILLSAAAAQTRGPATIFAPGVISGGDIFGITFSPDGQTVYFCETDKDIKHIQIMLSQRQGDRWSAPQPASFSPGTFRDIDPIITADGHYLIFQSNRPAPNRAESRTDFDVYIVDRDGGSWSAPRPLADLDSEANEVFVSATDNGTLYFASDRPGGKGKLDLYVAQRRGAGYAPATNLAELNTADDDSNPAIAPNEKFLVFVRRGDLYVSRRDGEHWNAPEKLPLVNTDEDTEYAPAFSPDGKTMYFTSTKFENGKRVKPGTIWSIPLAALNLPDAK